MNRLLPYLVASVLAAAVIALTSCATTRQAAQPKWHDLGMMSDPILDQVLLFYLGEAWAGMTDINECLETASRVKKDDAESWAREWRKTAERLNKEADRLSQEGHRESAGEYYLRAASYYRATMHRHMHPGSPEVKELTEREIICFVRSQELLRAPMEVVGIPYEGLELTGYYYRSAPATGPAPTLIVHQGRDAWAEDCKYIADEAIRRGYNCLLIDGPGNGQALRRHDLPFRPDWETFVTPVVDYLVARADVDRDRIILMGMSMGGYLAAEAAAHEGRLRVCIANPGVLDWGAITFEQLREYSPQMLRMYERNPKALDSLLGSLGRLSPFLMWGLTDTMWKHGAKTPSEMLDKLKQFTNVDGVKSIRATTLVIDAEAEEYGQAKELYDALVCPKGYMMFTEAEAAPLHVQTGSLAVASQRVFDWLDTVLRENGGSMKPEQSPERRILDAAIQCIEMVGIQAVTIRKIARIAGVNSAAINYYFRSKDALLDRVLAATTENAFGDWERVIEDSTIPLVDRLRSILLEALEGTQAFPNLVKAHLHGPIMQSDYETAFAKRFRAFMVRAREAVKQTLPGSPDDLENRLVALFSATFGMGLLRGLFSEYIAADLGRPESRASYLELLLRQFLGGES